MSEKTEYAYAYCRYSSHNQDDGWSIEAQKAAIQKYAKEHHIKVKKFFVDEAKTGRNTNRPGYQKMITALETGEVKILLIAKLDRMHRKALNQLSDFEKLNKLNIRLVAVADQIDTSEPNTALITAIKSAIAEQFSQNLSNETRKGLMEAAKSCLHCGGTPPYGFKLNEEKLLEIDDTTAPAVRRIFKMYLADMGYSAIIEWLTNHNYRTQKGNIFSKTAINSILHNEKYAGVFVYDKSSARDEEGKRNSHAHKENYLRIEGGCPAIVTPEDYALVQDKLRQNEEKRRKFRAKRYYPLNGKVWKTGTRERLTGNVNHSNGKEYYQYRCCKKGMKSVNAELLEETVFFALRTLLFADEHEEALLAELNDYASEKHAESNYNYSQLKQSHVALQNKINSLLALCESGNSPVSVLDRIKSLESEMELLECQLTQCNTNLHFFTIEDLNAIRDAFIPYMISENTLEAKNLIDKTLKSISVNDEEVEIKFFNGINMSKQTAEFFE